MEKAILNKVRDNTGTELMHEVGSRISLHWETDIAKECSRCGLMVEAAN